MKLIEIWPGQIYQRGEFRKLPLAEKLARMADRGINMVLNVSPRNDAELAQAMGYRYRHTHIADSAHADFEAVELAVVWALNGLTATPENRLLVHCHAGRNRSSLLSAILLMELHGLSGIEAVAHLRKVRPNALATGAFVDYLEQRPSRLLMGAGER
jgi:protein-tyrosine phosphatase